MVTEANKAVARGVRLLDQFKPNWAKHINLKKFDLGSSKYCVLGQNGGFTKQLENIANDVINKALGRAQVQFNEGFPEKPAIDASYYGFDSGENSTYDDLIQAWVRVVKRRQAK